MLNCGFICVIISNGDELMEAKEILSVLEQISNNDTYKKIFINGAWGVGKSYYTQEYISKNNDNFVYVTLFGKPNFESFQNDLSNELLKKMNHLKRKMKDVKKILNKISGSFSYKGFSINTPDLTSKNLILEYRSLLESKPLIIVIDDLERKSGNILIEDIMGMIESLSQFEKVKLVIIGDENNMTDDDRKKWGKFKEKLIEKEYKIVHFSDDAIDNLVTKQVSNYIEDSEIENLINNYIKKHNVKNLRTIIKGINLFKEIINNYIEIKDNKKVNLMILKNCMSVAIECTENLYKPDENNKSKNPFQYSIDDDITSRIAHHYFSPFYISNNESCALYYVLKIFNCDYSKSTISQLNDTVNGYLNIKTNDKQIFYLSETEISKQIHKLYNLMKNNKYEYVSIDQFIEDFYEISKWNDVLQLGLDFNDLSSSFNDILFENYYNPTNELRKNIIDRFNLKTNESKSLGDLINKYNEEANSKYVYDKFSLIRDSFCKQEYDIKLLEWLDFRLIQDDKQKIQGEFIAECRKNNFFIPDVSGEISDEMWGWIHEIWKLFYERMEDKYKQELNSYAEKLKKNKLSLYRINALQEYRPLVKND